jgi:hypothetical protein
LPHATRTEIQALLAEAERRKLDDVDSMRLCFQTLSLAARIDRDCAALLAPHGLSEGRFVLLFLLESASEGLAPNHLAEQAGITRATVTGLLDGLEREALAERRPTRPTAARCACSSPPRAASWRASCSPSTANGSPACFPTCRPPNAASWESCWQGRRRRGGQRMTAPRPRRKGGANRTADITPELLQALSLGEIETATLTESLAVDQARLLQAVFPDAWPHLRTRHRRWASWASSSAWSALAACCGRRWARPAGSAASRTALTRCAAGPASWRCAAGLDLSQRLEAGAAAGR